MGSSMDPFTAFLIKRGMETLKLRMERINSSSSEIASRLSDDKRVDAVYYPMHENHPDLNTAGKILDGGGGIVTFSLRKNPSEILSSMKKMKNVPSANTLGGLETGISHPSSMSHRSLSDKELEMAGIGKNMVRLSVGIESTEYIWEDIELLLQ